MWKKAGVPRTFREALLTLQIVRIVRANVSVFSLEKIVVKVRRGRET